MIHHAIHSGVKEWDKLLPFMLWAYRETPNATTGISPFELVYGKPARGPLAVLRETWAADQNSNIPTGLGETGRKYLQKLKEDLEITKKIAAENSEKNQRRYVDNYNLRSRTKSFQEGEVVIVLMADSTNKVYSRWIGPVKIRKKLSENSYNVEMEDGSVRRLHANHLRKYHERTNAVGVVYEDDGEFGELEYIPVREDDGEEIEEKFQRLEFEHLSESEKRDIRKILTKHKDVFSDQPGCCDRSVAEHVIKLKVKPEDWPKQSKPYRVPPILRDEVDRQINGKTPFVLQCDASNGAVASCLAQQQPDGSERPIAYASAKLSESQKNWSVIEKEGYSVIFGLRRFETYLIGAPVIIHTDHNPLKYIVECSPKSARLTRWALSLQKFNVIEVKYKRGVDNTNADALSRLMTNIDDTDPDPPLRWKDIELTIPDSRPELGSVKKKTKTTRVRNSVDSSSA